MNTPTASTSDPRLRQAVPRLRAHLERLYPADVAAATLPRLLASLEDATRAINATDGPIGPGFDETDVVLITYGDQIRERGTAPLESLRRFLDDHVGDVVTGVHLLPHYPWSSDDGFAVTDHTAVDPSLGTWRDVEALGSRFRLMLDAVVNHASASHPWYLGWLYGDDRYRDYFLDVDPAADLSGVVRPRTTPLLTPATAGDVERHVWTTFGPDQMDLNYANPEVLLAVTDLLLGYLGHGASILRLDAVAFLWKELGTSCLHLPQTHEVVRLWRTVVDTVAPGTLLITETNVPQDENVSYFGDGTDEAHLVYQFPLPPLTLAAFASGDATRLRGWLATQQPPSSRTAFFNFLGSHDGIGVRPAEGLLTDAEVDELAAAVERSGGHVSYRALADGSRRPYELNAVYYDALNGNHPQEPEDRHIARFLSAQSILLALAGVPALYVHALFGSRNWAAGAAHTGRARVINRQRFDRETLEGELADPHGRRARILDGLRRRLAARIAEPAFHPSGPQLMLEGPTHQLAFQRLSVDGARSVVCLHEIAGRAGRVRTHLPAPLPSGTELEDLLDGATYVTEADGTLDVDLPPFATRWLRART